MEKTEAVIDVIGKKGEDLYIKVPRGTVIRDSETRKINCRFIKRRPM